MIYDSEDHLINYLFVFIMILAGLGIGSCATMILASLNAKTFELNRKKFTLGIVQFIYTIALYVIFSYLTVTFRTSSFDYFLYITISIIGYLLYTAIALYIAFYKNTKNQKELNII